MRLGRYFATKLVVGALLFVVTVPIAIFGSAALAYPMPEAARPFAFAGVGLIWLMGNVLEAEIITRKIGKRWSR